MVVAVLLLVLLVLLAALYLNRRAAAREVLVGWLERQGIAAEVEVERIELDGFIGRVRIGDPRDPDFQVERVEVDYAVAGPWSRAGLGLTPSRIRLVRPVLRARWRDGKLTLGSLDPLIERFTGRPPRPDAQAPLILVEDGRLRLDTEYGQVAATGDARIEDGKLMRLVARMPASALKSGAVEAQGLSAALDLRTTGDRIVLGLNARADQLALPGAQAGGVRLTLAADLPYPDLKTRRGDGRAVIQTGATAGSLRLGQTQAQGAEAALAFDGAVSGWIETFRLQGVTRADLGADRIAQPGLAGRGIAVRAREAAVSLTRDDDGLRWSLTGPATASAGALTAGDLNLTDAALRFGRLTAGGRDGAFEARGPARLDLARLAFGDLALDRVTGRLDVDAVHGGATLIQAGGSLAAARGAWPLLGPATAADGADLAAMKAALGAFALEAPGVRLTTGSPGTTVALTRPVRVRPANGGVLTLAAAGRPLYSAEPGDLGGGALTLAATRGRGLPEAAFRTDWRLTGDGFAADLDGRAALDFDLGRGVALTTRGTLTSGGGRLTYAARGCTPLTIERLELGENDITDLSGRFCPAGAPLVTATDGGWRVEGAIRDAGAAAPFLALRFNDIDGRLAVVGGPRGIALTAGVEQARIIDATSPRRFNPLVATGSARLESENWTGHFDLGLGGAPLSRIEINHDGPAERGGMIITAPELIFAEGALQPADLTPLVEPFMQSPVSGQVGFSGHIDWTPEGGSSAGLLEIPRLDFVSPAGPVTGLAGRIEFTSLAPLTTARNQRLTIERIAAVAPLESLQLDFGLDKTGVTVSGGEIRAAGGTVRIEPFVVPLDRTQPFSGVLVLDRVQLGELLAGSGFGDTVSLDAVVSGRLPFTSDPMRGVRISGGSLQAVQPGRLSIQREALSEIEAGGGGSDVPPNTVQDLAYQAMENLAFDILTAEVNSLDEGRLGVLFRIRGRHDPPQRQELRLSLGELISREFLNRTLPLPSDTGIDLTLDTTLNLNQLIGDLMAINRARNGEAPATPAD